MLKERLSKGIVCLTILGLLWGLEAESQGIQIEDRETSPSKGGQKALILDIIEENWDDLEFRLPMYRGGPPKPMTKREALEYYHRGITNLKLQVKDNKSREEVKERITAFLLKERKGGRLSKDIRFNVSLRIVYYGKTYFLKDEDTFMIDAFRLGRRGSGRYYDKIPEKISILLYPRVFHGDYKKYVPPLWDRFEEIRLVEDIYILSVNERGDLRIRIICNLVGR